MNSYYVIMWNDTMLEIYADSPESAESIAEAETGMIAVEVRDAAGQVA